MGITPKLFSSVWLWLTNIALLGVVVWAVREADWDQVAVERLFQHSFFASVLLLFLLWQLRAGLSLGLTSHLLGMKLFRRSASVGWSPS
ncbi:hypothetical protein [Marinobacter sp. JSM 1782161]|uniref:hypothetical protein n=1 Tax=Marinobacter sp. JSM 1782161 TaxID=2685906 RepID=UPI001D19205D|nr:hypothetical protein [Marinobacter sp. JSM 1782161]